MVTAALTPAMGVGAFALEKARMNDASAQTENLAARLYGPSDLRLEQMPRPQCPPGGLLLRVLACGICHSDIKMWRQGHKELSLPRVLGHEIVARVVEAAPGVKGFEPGDLVQVFPGLACGRCPECRQGRHQRCPQVKVMGFSFDGGLARYLALPAAALELGGVSRLPVGLSPPVATLAEPLACALNALEAAGLEAGQALAVFGAGVMGRLLALAAREMGAARVTLLELAPERCRDLEVPVLDISGGFHASALRRRLGGSVDVVVPACPDPRALEWGLELLRPGGRLVLFSGLPGSPQLDLNQLHYRELSLVGAYGCNAGQNRQALKMLARRAKEVEALIGARLPLAQVARALELAAAGRGLKVVLEM